MPTNCLNVLQIYEQNFLSRYVGMGEGIVSIPWNCDQSLEGVYYGES